MMSAPELPNEFLLQNRFAVNVLCLEIDDRQQSLVCHLEPRVMKLLCCLVAQRGQVVQRAELIREVWNDYPGADDGLFQAISFLRKCLHDEQKQCMRTFPKTGYLFAGTYSEEPGTPEAHALATSTKTPVLLWPGKAWSAAVALLLVLGVVFYPWVSPASPVPPEKPNDLQRDEGRKQAALEAIKQVASSLDVDTTQGTGEQLNELRRRVHLAARARALGTLGTKQPTTRGPSPGDSLFIYH
jgi:DNA-binding winged helix-turn-helix (wHTH) protein